MNREKETSLLPKLDNGKILAIKDLTPLISEPGDTRAEVLGQFRDAYDGSSSKAYGTGELRAFESRLVVVTPTDSPPKGSSPPHTEVPMAPRLLSFLCIPSCPVTLTMRTRRALIRGMSAA